MEYRSEFAVLLDHHHPMFLITSHDMIYAGTRGLVMQFCCFGFLYLTAGYVVDLDQSGHAELKFYCPADGLDILYEQVAFCY